MIKVAISGSHGVGKTTLAYSISNCYADYNVKINTHIARELIRQGYPLGREATDESYIQYIIAQLAAEQEASNIDLFISDRSLLDPLSYAIVNMKTEGSTVSQSIIELLKCIWLLELQQYDLYIFVPIEFSMIEDGVRPKGEKYRKLVENQMIQLLEEYHVKYIRVFGTIEERNAQAVNAINIILNDNNLANQTLKLAPQDD